VKAKEQIIDALLPPLDLGKLSSALTPMQHQRSTSVVNASYIYYSGNQMLSESADTFA
jgi:hypothetical protein